MASADMPMDGLFRIPPQQLHDFLDREVGQLVLRSTMNAQTGSRNSNICVVDAVL